MHLSSGFLNTPPHSLNWARIHAESDSGNWSTLQRFRSSCELLHASAVNHSIKSATSSDESIRVLLVPDTIGTTILIHHVIQLLPFFAHVWSTVVAAERKRGAGLQRPQTAVPNPGNHWGFRVREDGDALVRTASL